MYSEETWRYKPLISSYGLRAALSQTVVTVTQIPESLPESHRSSLTKPEDQVHKDLSD